MKTFKIILLVLALSTGFARAQFTKAELQVSGLTCALCAKGTENSLKKLPFIGEVKTDLIRNTYLLIFKTGAHVNFDEISKQVRDGNFFVSSLKVTFDFNSIKTDDKRFSFDGDTFQLMNADKAPSGQTDLTIVDKGFAPKVVSKKYLGQAGDIGAKPASGRLYHVAI